MLPRHYRDGQCRQKFCNKIITEDWDLVFCLWPRNKATEFRTGWWDIPSAKETEISKVPHLDHVDNFFRLSRLSAQRIRTVPEGKTVNAEFCKGVMDHLLKCIQGVRPDAFCSRDFFLLHDNAPAHKDVFTNFLPQKSYNPLSPPPVLSRFISARLFFVPRVEN